MISKKWRPYFFGLLTTCIIGFSNPLFASNPNDPYEPLNRVMYKFNDLFDRIILKPVAKLYNLIVPKPVAKCLGNFYANVDMIPTIINDILQANFYQLTGDTWRFGINSTIGILGLFDVASRWGLEPNSQDFGLTLARWGYKKSTYLVIPFMGPSTIRDGISFPINYYFMTPYPLIKPWLPRFSWYSGGVIVGRAELLHHESFMQEAALDKYVFMRDAYLQHRNYLIERNEERRLSPKTKTEGGDSSVENEVKAVEVTRPFSNI